MKSPPDWHSVWKFEKVPYLVHCGNGGQGGLTLRRFRKPVLLVNWTKRTKLPNGNSSAIPVGRLALWACALGSHRCPALIRTLCLVLCSSLAVLEF